MMLRVTLEALNWRFVALPSASSRQDAAFDKLYSPLCEE